MLHQQEYIIGPIDPRDDRGPFWLISSSPEAAMREAMNAAGPFAGYFFTELRCQAVGNTNLPTPFTPRPVEETETLTERCYQCGLECSAYHRPLDF